MVKKATRIAYLGMEGSFTHEAALSRFSGQRMIEKDTLEDVFDAVFVQEADYAVLPVENSTQGIIALAYHKLVEQGLNAPVRIQGEIYHPISHNLCAKSEVPLDSIRYVHTKKEAWDQCRKWISNNLPKEVQFVPESSTSVAAKRVAEHAERERAAISGTLAMQRHGLTPIARAIQDLRDNATRFFVIGRRPLRRPRGPVDYKVSLAMVLLDRIGAIADAFRVFADTRVDVRSVKVSPVRAPGVLEWKDWFFVDVLVSDGEFGRISQALEELRSQEGLVLTIRELGRYPSVQPKGFPGTRTALPRVPRDFGRPGGLPLEGVLGAGEGATTEFKSTLAWNIRENKRDKAIEFAVLKTIVGFMNSKGGVLLIGVEDDGTIRGLQQDYAILKKPSKDGFELHLGNLVHRSLGGASAHLVDVAFASRQGKDICIVTVQPSPSPIWIQSEGKNEFYMRIGNQTRPLDSKETAEYVKLRWS